MAAEDTIQEQHSGVALVALQDLLVDDDLGGPILEGTVVEVATRQHFIDAPLDVLDELETARAYWNLEGQYDLVTIVHPVSGELGVTPRAWFRAVGVD